MAAHEVAGAGERQPAGFQMRVPHRPDMNHVRPDFEHDRDVGDADEADRVVHQRFVGTDLN